MIKINLTIVLCIFSMLSMLAQTNLSDESASYEYVAQLCYKKSETTKILVQGELNTETLNVREKLKFKTTELVNQCNNSFDLGGNAFTQIFTTSHSNIYPKWFEPATEISIKEDGLRSYFDNPMALFADGWGGAHVATGLGGASYSIEESTERRHSFSEHSELSKKAYDQSNFNAQEYGFLGKVRFQLPSLSDLEERGYTFKDGILTVSMGQKTYIWDAKHKTISQMHYVGAKLAKSVHKSYTFNENLKDYLISEVHTLDHLQFENGDCYSKKTIVTYSDYNTSCDNGLDDLDSRSNKTSADENKILVFPNPSSDEITIRIPRYDGKSKVLLYSIDGKLLLQRSASSELELFKLDIAHFNNGLYLVKVIQDDNSFTGKFSKN